MRMSIMTKVDDIVKALDRYQERDNAELLVYEFRAFINDYVLLIHYGMPNLKKKYIREFISYFVPDKINRNLIKGRKYMGNAAHESMSEAIKYISQIFKYEYEDESFNEILIPFLEIAKRYKSNKMDFRYFLIKHFGKYLKTYINKYHNGFDPLLRAKRYSFFEHFDDMQVTKDIFTDELKLTTERHTDFDELDFINGYNLTFFKEFSRTQRKIIYYKYIKKQTDKDIAYKLSMHEKSVQRARSKAVNKLWKAIESREIKSLIPIKT